VLSQAQYIGGSVIFLGLLLSQVSIHQNERVRDNYKNLRLAEKMRGMPISTSSILASKLLVKRISTSSILVLNAQPKKIAISAKRAIAMLSMDESIFLKHLVSNRPRHWGLFYGLLISS
jgi:hypothetical protein